MRRGDVNPTGPMKGLNYRHLRYFYVVAKSGGVSAAARKLNVAQPTISAQLKQFERDLGVTLFEPAARPLGLTPVGKAVLEYAESILSLGDDLVRSVADGEWARTRRVHIGVSNLLPKMIVPYILRPALDALGPVSPELAFRVDRATRLTEALSRGSVDVVLTDGAEAGNSSETVVQHLGSSRIAVFATKDAARRVSSGFPYSLEGAPFLMPSRKSLWGMALEAWFVGLGIEPRIVGEFDDSAMMKNFGRLGLGMFPGLATFSAEISHQYAVEVVGIAESVVGSVYALTRRDRLQDPLLARLLGSLQTDFGG
jgi:LysR family transcriptional regulator, transcriptional activator of nhaA